MWVLAKMIADNLKVMLRQSRVGAGSLIEQEV